MKILMQGLEETLTYYKFSCRTLEENTDDELYGEANQGDPQEDQGCRGFSR